MKHAATLLFLGFIVAGCGGAALEGPTATSSRLSSLTSNGIVEIDATALGACSGDTLPQHAPSVATLLDAATAAWIEVDGADFVAAVTEADSGVDLVDLRLPTASSLSSAPVPEVVRVYPSAVIEASTAATAGANILIGYPSRWTSEYPPITPVVAGEFPDGTTSFLGECARVLYTDLFLRASGGEQLDTSFVRAALVPGSTAAQAVLDASAPAVSPGQEWSERDPMLRSLDPSRTPAERLLGLEPVAVLISIPNAWTSLNGFICVRTSLGWHPLCVPTSLASSGEFVGRFTPLVVADDKTTVEIWLLGSLNYEDRIAQIGAVELEPGATRSDLTPLVRLVTEPSDPSALAGSVNVAEVVLLSPDEVAAARAMSADAPVEVDGP